MYRAAFIITLLLCGCGHGKEDKAKVKLVYVYRRDDAVRCCSSTVGQPKGAESRRERERREKDGRAKEKKKEEERERERRKGGVEGGFAQLEQATTHNGGRQARGRDSNKRGGGCKKEHASERVVAPQWRNFQSSSCYDYDYIERYR